MWWSVDVYTYATGHTPIPNKGFAKNGGVVYTVMKHDGEFSYQGSMPHSFRRVSTSIGNTGGLLVNEIQSPSSWTSVQEKIYSCTSTRFLFRLRLKHDSNQMV